MSQIIYKYPLKMAIMQEVALPQRTKILSIQFQQDQLVLWALIDDKSEPVSIAIEIFGTGHIIDPPACGMDRTHLATAQHADGMVWHVFIATAYDPLRALGELF